MKKELLIASALVSTLGAASVANAVTASTSGSHHTGLRGTDSDSSTVDTVAQVVASSFSVSLSETTDGGVGIASTTYVRSVVMHNTGLGTARVSLYINNGTTPVETGYGITAARILRVDVAPNETTFFESNYPIVLTHHDSIAVEVNAPDAGGAGIGSAVNFIVNGDTDV